MTKPAFKFVHDQEAIVLHYRSRQCTAIALRAYRARPDLYRLVRLGAHRYSVRYKSTVSYIYA